MLFKHLPSNDCSVDVAFGVHTHAFSAAVILCRGLAVFDEILHRSVLCTPDADAFLPARLVRAPGLRVGHINRVVACDGDPAGSRKLLPCFEILSVLIEDLNSVVATITDEE